MGGPSLIETQDAQAINLRDVIRKCTRCWYWFVIGLAVAMVGAYCYNHYATPVYQADAELLIKDDKGTGTGSGDLQNDILGQLSMLTGNSNVQNEMAVLASRTIIEKAVRDLGLQSTYFVAGRFHRDEEIYLKTPVLVTPLLLKDSVRAQLLRIIVNPDNTYVVADDNGKAVATDGGIATLSSGIFLIRKNSHRLPTDTVFRELIAVVSPLAMAVRDFQGNLSLSQTDKTSSVIQLTLKTTVPRKGEDFLNTLIKEYSLAGLNDKNLTAANTISFVDSRIDSISRELSNVENKMEAFLSANSIADIDEQSKLFIDQAGQIDQQIAQQSIQMGVLNQILQYVSQPEKAHALVPSTLGIQDPTLVTLVQSYNELQLKYFQQIAAGAGPENPIIKLMNQQLAKLRDDIQENTKNILKGAQRMAVSLNKQNQDFEGRIRNVPRLQRDYITIKRQQEIKQDLYVYLLQKREEAAITKAASVSNNRVIDAAKTNLVPISPKKRLIDFAAILLGLAIPGGLIYLKEILSRKISSRQDVEAHTDAPVYGEIGHSGEKTPIVVVSGTRGVVPEQFRALRTNLSFVLGTGQHKTILITSSMGGEGKSFVSLNLAMTYALMGKRTVLLGLDLRKPKIGNYVGMEHQAGVSNYLAGQMELDALPVELNFGQHNLYFINSGPIPPNPAELLLQAEMDILMDYLKRSFDYIILDTPPVGLVTDAQIVGKYADTSLYIVRHQYTLKEQVRLLDGYYKAKRLANLGVVLNDIKAGDSYRYGYGSYGYGNGYYSDNGSANRSAKVNKSRLDNTNKGSNGMYGEVKKRVEEL